MKIFLTALILFSSISISATNWRINWQHSRIGFSIDYMGVSEVQGSFNKFDGAFTFNQHSLELSDVEVVISTKSLDTDNQKRDSHLEKKDFFHITKFPRILFKSTKTEIIDNKTMHLHGLITLLGITKPTIFKVSFKGEVSDPWDKNKKAIFFDAKTKINRKDFGMTWNKVMDTGGYILGDDVSLDLKIEAFKEGVRPAFSRFYLPTKQIKKSVKSEILKKDFEPAPAPKKKLNPVVKKKSQNEAKEISVTIVVGFVLFIILIFLAIWIQMKFTKLLEKLNFGPKITFLIPNLSIMIFLYIMAIKLAPYMGYGPHPLAR